MNRPAAKRIAAYAGLLLAVYLAALLLLFPADVGWRLAEARMNLPVAVTADSVSGRIWNGQADGLRVDRDPVGSVAWRLQPASLLRGRLGLKLRWESGNDHLDASVRLGTRSAQAADVRGGLGAERIQAWFDLPLLLGGHLTLDVARIRWSAGAGFTDAGGALLWAGAGAGLPRPVPLGDYRADLSATDGALLARIDTGPGAALAAEGTASWHPAGEYHVDLELSAAPDADRNLVAAIDNIAQRQPDGRHRLQLSGR